MERPASPYVRYLLSPYTDIDTKASSDGKSIQGLDGLRGLAVLIVIASHTAAFGMHGQGSLGVLLFFILSGFLLALPFIDQPARIFRIEVVLRFFANRFLRIIPAYAVAVAYIAWYRQEPWEWFVKHMVFIGGWDHFWSVAQEGRFYLLFPSAVALLALLPGRALRMAALGIAILVAHRFKSDFPIELLDGFNGVVQFYFWFFLAGMLTSFAAPLFKEGRTLFNVVALLVIAAPALLSDTMVSSAWAPYFGIQPATSLNGWQQPEAWCVAFALLLIGVTQFPDTLAGKLSASRIMRHIGLLSYGMYLFHVPVMIFLRPWKLEGEVHFVATMALTYAVAIVSYLLVEKPFLALKPKATKAAVVTSPSL